jgi:hypothetical protein
MRTKAVTKYNRTQLALLHGEEHTYEAIDKGREQDMNQLRALLNESFLAEPILTLKVGATVRTFK